MYFQREWNTKNAELNTNFSLQKEFTDDCVFNESMEQHNYNTYSSTYNSNTRRKYYLALNRHGEPRKLQIPPSRSLGKLATYTNAIPETVPQERVEQLIAKNFGANRVKHGIRQLCDTGKPLIELIDSKNFKARPKCNPNNSNNNSNSKNTLSRNIDKDNSLVSHNHHQHQHHHTNKQHNCTTPLNRPTSFTKRGNQLGPLRQQKCQNLLLQQQQAGVSEIVLPPMCTKKGGSKNKQQQANKRAQGKNSLGTDGLGPNNRRGKKLNMNRAGNAGSRQAAKNQQQGSGANNNGTKKKQNKNSKKGGGNNNNNNNGNKKNKKSNSNSSSTSTTEKTESTSTLKTKLWETTSLVPSTTLYDNYDPHGETTSDRGDREQRNIRYSNSMEEYMEQSSEDTSAVEDPDDDDNDMENNDENNEDASYEDDSYISSSSHMPYAAAESSHTPLTAGADDFLYYDQLDL
ncbi:hypothetical protein DOY81_005492 [Sarcophaga bullata]|nr:hypothetical protein DOY81_005492 [Sarcophaga bullata]